MAFGIYIHWPFCRSKCPYCDFFSKVNPKLRQDELIEEYLEDINYYASLVPDPKITSIFFGGGTPSLISPQNIEKIINQIHKKYSCAKKIEISLEANPNTNRPNLFTDLKNAGINRLSLGIQSLNDKNLKFLGRTHSLQDAIKSAQTVLNTFDNHSADLMYALPNQNISEWQQELEQLCKMRFKHLSLYQLTIENGTVFAKKGIQAANEETSIALYQLSNDILASYNYNRYEVSNYASKDFECKHNLLYWQGDNYIGIGQGAHGRLQINNQYYATTHPRKFEELSAIERAQELVFMGLRLTEGINKERFKQLCGYHFNEVINKSKLQELIATNFLLENDTHIRTTSSGNLALNQIINQLLD